MSSHCSHAARALLKCSHLWRALRKCSHLWHTGTLVYRLEFVSFVTSHAKLSKDKNDASFLSPDLRAFVFVLCYKAVLSWFVKVSHLYPRHLFSKRNRGEPTRALYSSCRGDFISSSTRNRPATSSLSAISLSSEESNSTFVFTWSSTVHSKLAGDLSVCSNWDLHPSHHLAHSLYSQPGK